MTEQEEIFWPAKMLNATLVSDMVLVPCRTVNVQEQGGSGRNNNIDGACGVFCSQ